MWQDGSALIWPVVVRLLRLQWTITSPVLTFQLFGISFGQWLILSLNPWLKISGRGLVLGVEQVYISAADDGTQHLRDVQTWTAGTVWHLPSVVWLQCHTAKCRMLACEGGILYKYKTVTSSGLGQVPATNKLARAMSRGHISHTFIALVLAAWKHALRPLLVCMLTKLAF